LPETKALAFFSMALMFLLMSSSWAVIAGTCGFKSTWAPRMAAVSALGFLGALGFVTGWERLFGFMGFFGLIGVACLVETVVRFRDRPA
jgi:hypothetical protein